MEKQDVIAALAALAQETRLDVFRRLVRAGPDGVPAGQISSELDIPPATLSFHLKELRSARLATSEREGRVIRYAPDFAVIAAVVAYLGDHCCEDARGCGPIGRSGTRSRGGAAKPVRTARPSSQRKGASR
jgi:ArsR family transcriptional regulator